MLEAFAAELPQMLGPLGEWMGRWKIMEAHGRSWKMVEGS
jgi:hypothetical protein